MAYSAFFCFTVLALVAIPSQCVPRREEERGRHHHNRPEGGQRPDNGDSGGGGGGGGNNPTVICVEQTSNDGGGCRTFQSCCATRCGGEDYNVRCVVEEDRMIAQCTCTGSSGGGGGGGNDGSSSGIWGRPQRTTTSSWGTSDDTGDSFTTLSSDDNDPYRQPSTDDQSATPAPQPSTGGGGGGSSSGQCGKSQASQRQEASRIVGGQEATAHSWPWQASLQLRGQHICGASLVDPRHVVTAAHCFQMSNQANAYKIVLGLHDRARQGSGAITVNVQQITKHPNYNSPNEHSNDIAVLRLSNPVQFSATISPICLPNNAAQDGKQCVVTGWGETQGTGDNQLLLQVAVPIVPQNTCNDRRHYRGAIDDTMMCAGVAGRDSCQGDSGGPLVCQRSDSTWELQGVVSWGIDCAAENKPGVYSRVSVLKNWIQEQMNA